MVEVAEVEVTVVATFQRDTRSLTRPGTVSAGLTASGRLDSGSEGERASALDGRPALGCVLACVLADNEPESELERERGG